jgi:hypothetical protein
MYTDDEIIEAAQKIGYLYIAPIVLVIGIIGSLANLVKYIPQTIKCEISKSIIKKPFNLQLRFKNLNYLTKGYLLKIILSSYGHNCGISDIFIR